MTSWTLAAAVVIAMTVSALPGVRAQNRIPSARLVPATTISFASPSDSNSPAAWEMVDGSPRLFVLTSISGQTTRQSGPQLSRLSTSGPALFANHPGHGVWFEAVIPDVDGTWYGYYHQERAASVCGETVRTIPRIGAARSTDYGATWEDLGVVLEAPPRSHDCASTNKYFVGGVGDFSVVLDQDARYLYFFFSQYASRESVQGVSAARLAWADRDAPAGKMAVWLREQTWLPTRSSTSMANATRYFYPAGMPIYAVTGDWHSDASAGAFWGPSVHYNTYLEQYVMLLNRARSGDWTQEGIYVAFTNRLEDPRSWSTPQRLLSGGRWYPQVLGTEVGAGTDKVAGERPRMFMSGRSEHFIQFSR